MVTAFSKTKKDRERETLSYFRVCGQSENRCNESKKRFATASKSYGSTERSFATQRIDGTEGSYCVYHLVFFITWKAAQFIKIERN